MKKASYQKLQKVGARANTKPRPDAVMDRLREQYLASGVTEQEFAMIQRAAGNPAQAALVIALVMARLEEDGLLQRGGIEA